MSTAQLVFQGMEPAGGIGATNPEIPILGLRVASSNVVEGGSIGVDIVRSVTMNGVVMVTWTATATAGVLTGTTTNRVTFPSGTSVISFVLQTLARSGVQPTEDILVTLSAIDGGELDPLRTQVTLHCLDDGTRPVIWWQLANRSQRGEASGLAHLAIGDIITTSQAHEAQVALLDTISENSQGGSNLNRVDTWSKVIGTTQPTGDANLHQLNWTNDTLFGTFLTFLPTGASFPDGAAWVCWQFHLWPSTRNTNTGDYTVLDEITRGDHDTEYQTMGGRIIANLTALGHPYKRFIGIPCIGMNEKGPYQQFSNSRVRYAAAVSRAVAQLRIGAGHSDLRFAHVPARSPDIGALEGWFPTGLDAIGLRFEFTGAHDSQAKIDSFLDGTDNTGYGLTSDLISAATTLGVPTIFPDWYVHNEVGDVDTGSGPAIDPAYDLTVPANYKMFKHANATFAIVTNGVRIGANEQEPQLWATQETAFFFHKQIAANENWRFRYNLTKVTDVPGEHGRDMIYYCAIFGDGTVGHPADVSAWADFDPTEDTVSLHTTGVRISQGCNAWVTVPPQTTEAAHVHNWANTTALTQILGSPTPKAELFKLGVPTQVTMTKIGNTLFFDVTDGTTSDSFSWASTAIGAVRGTIGMRVFRGLWDITNFGRVALPTALACPVADLAITSTHDKLFIPNVGQTVCDNINNGKAILDINAYAGTQAGGVAAWGRAVSNYKTKFSGIKSAGPPVDDYPNPLRVLKVTNWTDANEVLTKTTGTFSSTIELVSGPNRQAPLKGGDRLVLAGVSANYTSRPAALTLGQKTAAVSGTPVQIYGDTIGGINLNNDITCTGTDWLIARISCKSLYMAQAASRTRFSRCYTRPAAKRNCIQIDGTLNWRVDRCDMNGTDLTAGQGCGLEIHPVNGMNGEADYNYIHDRTVGAPQANDIEAIRCGTGKGHTNIKGANYLHHNVCKGWQSQGETYGNKSSDNLWEYNRLIGPLSGRFSHRNGERCKYHGNDAGEVNMSFDDQDWEAVSNKAKAFAIYAGDVEATTFSPGVTGLYPNSLRGRFADNDGPYTLGQRQAGGAFPADQTTIEAHRRGAETVGNATRTVHSTTVSGPTYVVTTITETDVGPLSGAP